MLKAQITVEIIYSCSFKYLSPNVKEYITFLFLIQVSLSESVRHIVCVMAVLSPTIEDDWS